VTDELLLAKRLAAIETEIADLRRLARLDALGSDPVKRELVLESLQDAVQAALRQADRLRCRAASQRAEHRGRGPRRPVDAPRATPAAVTRAGARTPCALA
jgi:hypothetical protein